MYAFQRSYELPELGSASEDLCDHQLRRLFTASCVTFGWCSYHDKALTMMAIYRRMLYGVRMSCNSLVIVMLTSGNSFDRFNIKLADHMHLRAGVYEGLYASCAHGIRRQPSTPPKS